MSRIPKKKRGRNHPKSLPQRIKWTRSITGEAEVEANPSMAGGEEYTARKGLTVNDIPGYIPGYIPPWKAGAPLARPNKNHIFGINMPAGPKWVHVTMNIVLHL